MDYQLIVDIGVFVLIGIILVIMLVVPSKGRIRDQGIFYIPPAAKIGQYVMGALAILLCLGLLTFYFLKDGQWWNILNAAFLGPLGFMLIFNSYSTGKLLNEMAQLEGDVMPAAELDDEPVMAAEVAPAKSRKKPAAAAPVAPKKTYETITIECPGCSKFLKIQNRGEGTPITCPSCGLEGEL